MARTTPAQNPRGRASSVFISAVSLARKAFLFQALLCLPVWAQTPTETPKPKENPEIESIVPSEEPIAEEGTLKFGDPEVTWDGNEEMALPTKPTQVNPELEAAKKMKTPDERVRAIVASVKPGDAYPEEFSELVRMTNDAVPPLIQIFLDPSQSWQARWMVAMALGRIGGVEATDALTSGLKDPLFLVRMAAVTALGNTEDKTFAPMVRKALDDKAMVVRSAAVDALAKYRDLEAIPLLIEELKAKRNIHRGKSLWIREHICKALEELVTQDPPKATADGEDCAKTWIAWAQKPSVPSPQISPSPSSVGR